MDGGVDQLSRSQYYQAARIVTALWSARLLLRLQVTAADLVSLRSMKLRANRTLSMGSFGAFCSSKSDWQPTKPISAVANFGVDGDCSELLHYERAL